MAPVWKPNRITASIYLFLCAAGLLVSGIVTITSGKISALRLGLLGIALLLGAALSLLAFWNLGNARISDWWQHSTKGRRLDVLIGFSALTFLVCWIIVWTPIERFGSAYYYVLGVFPFIVWLTCASAFGGLLLLAERLGLDLERIKEYFQRQRIVFLIGALALFVFGVLVWLAKVRVVGMQPEEEDFWYGAGVPVVAAQVQLALVFGIGLAFLVNKWVAKNPATSKKVDIAIFVLIWAVSALLWAKEPVRPDFLITKPVAPNFEMYPDYDARNYDLMGQHALIGNGINNGFFFDRALYPAMLVYFHQLAGQDYTQVMALQAALYAVLPAFLYLLGKRLHSRAAGLGLGILLALRGVNNINVGDIIETAHQKHMLTEYPTAVLLVIATYLLVKWAQNPARHWKLAGLAGGIIGLSTLLRPHPLTIIPLIVAMVIVAYRHRTRLWMGVSALVVSAAILSILPWIQFSGHNVSIVSLYFQRIEDVIKQRYPQFNQKPSSSTAISGNLHLALAQEKPEKSVLAFAIDNFLNNLTTSVQALPNTPFNLEPRTLVKKTDDFWKPYWDGQLTPWAAALLPLNLIFLALGLGTAWQRARFAGLVPLFILVMYFAANALARASGGRYLVPIDWVVVTYYLLGIFAAVEFGLSIFFHVGNFPVTEGNVLAPKFSPWVGAAIVLLVSLMLGALIPLSQKLNPPRFAAFPQASLPELFIDKAGKQSNISLSDIQTFLSNPKAVILVGRSLYPRQFNKGEGLDISVYSFYHTFPYPRTLFTMLGPERLETVIILPRTDPAKIANASDVLVLGCVSDDYVTERFIRAWAVLSLDSGQLFERTPPAPLACPLPEPVCDDNKSCH